MTRILSLACVIWWTLCIPPAVADRIEPSDRVETRLRVRDGPSTEASIVGFIRPGQSAEFRSSIPHWYEVSLEDGTFGFVSKAWSRLVASEPTQPFTLRLGAWNIKKLGHGTHKDFAMVAEIIETNFDIVAIIEVMQKARGHPGYDELVAQLGSGWTGMVTEEPRPKTNSGSAEFYAIMYRPEKVRPCDGREGLVFHQDNDGSGAGAQPDLFVREPAFSCFEAVNARGPTAFDFVLAAYHARWSDGATDEIATEVSHLDDVFTAMAASRPGEGDLIVAGDFNLVPADFEEATGRGIPISGTGSTLNNQGQRTENLYDHLVVFDLAATAEIVGVPEIIDVRSVASDLRTFFQTISDHLPIVARFRTEGPDDD